MTDLRGASTDRAVVVFDIGGVLEVGEVIDAGGYPWCVATVAAAAGWTVTACAHDWRWSTRTTVR